MALPKAPKAPRAFSAVTDDIGAGRYPRPLLVAFASWVVLAILLFFARVGTPEPTDAEQSNQVLGQQKIVAPTFDSYPWAPYLPLLGVLVLVFAVLLFLGQGWTRLALALTGMLAVIGLAMTATWTAVPAGVLFLVGCVCTLMMSAHRYLAGRRDAGAVSA